MSSTEGHVTKVAGLTSHLPLLLLQNMTPLQRSPSSSLTHSTSLLQSQTLAPGLQLASSQASPLVHDSPSSQAKGPGSALAPLLGSANPQIWTPAKLAQVSARAARGWLTHLPVLGTQTFLLQALSSTVGQATTDAGLSLQAPSVLSQ